MPSKGNAHKRPWVGKILTVHWKVDHHYLRSLLKVKMNLAGSHIEAKPLTFIIYQMCTKTKVNLTRKAPTVDY